MKKKYYLLSLLMFHVCLFVSFYLDQKKKKTTYTGKRKSTCQDLGKHTLALLFLPSLMTDCIRKKQILIKINKKAFS